MLERHSIESALAGLEAAPQSRKRAMLLVLLVDAAIDARCPAGADPLAWRAERATADAALALVMELAAMRDDGARLVVEAVEVPLAEYPALTEAHYMVSLYNGATVPRLRVVAGSTAADALPLLRRAVAALGNG